MKTDTAYSCREIQERGKLIMAENDLTKENCMEMLRDAYKQLERYPKKSDFTVEEVAAVKSYFGPWPRALEACGILPDRSVEREAAKLQKRIAAKRRQTQYKLERQGRLKEQTDDKKQRKTPDAGKRIWS